ncbi:TlpA family protein disulfide reductase [Chitinophaga silvatica]|uniref:TlpA family protein disulfide reductase n=1 Tax=Chitinophaga silvatica TaxID=2282649 RepID=A0A3E1YGZ1_9BACT|nr:TlpA disulfide reductase family protein [Chitinophaga silvatica]RFS26628.1 TlpA family protein disulfide reductase [Chitinophaga silvatica]
MKSLLSSVVIGTFLSQSLYAVDIHIVKKNANAASAGVQVMVYGQKGTLFSQQLKFNEKGETDLHITATNSTVYWIGNTPFYLAANEAISLEFPEQSSKSGVIGIASVSGDGNSITVTGNNKEQQSLLLNIQRSWAAFDRQSGNDFYASLQQQESSIAAMLKKFAGEKDALKFCRVYSQAMSVTNRAAWIRKQEGVSVPAGFYDILKTSSPNDTLTNVFDRLLLSNYINAYTELSIRSAKTNELVKTKYQLEHFNSYRVSEIAGHNILYYLTKQGLDEKVSSLLPLAKSKIQNPELLQQIVDKEAGLLKISKNTEAPSFELPGADGQIFRLSDYKGKVVAIDVWATWCSACIKEQPDFLALREEFKTNNNIVFVTVSIDDERNEIKWRDYLHKKNMNGIELLANGEKGKNFMKGFSIVGIPRYIIIDKEGKVVESYGPKPSEPAYRKLIETSLIK